MKDENWYVWFWKKILVLNRMLLLMENTDFAALDGASK
jgi:hypothetical protein